MTTSLRGTFVISWSQTEVEGMGAAPLRALTSGASWSWRGEAVRVDGPNELLRLEQTSKEGNIRKRAARMVQHLVGAAVAGATRADDLSRQHPDETPLADNNFVVTDGTQSYTITLIEVGPGQPPLLMFFNEIPPVGVDMWVVHQSYESPVNDPHMPDAGGVICFTPGTWIETLDGRRRIEGLREGDQVMTRDNGPQDIQWIGQRRMTGARLFAMPRLRPVRFRAGALGIDRPDDELVVSPEHRMLVRGPVARALFNTDEVLVRARDMINGNTINVDSQLREVTYVHLLLPSHQVVWANGVETESFHPASTALSSLSDMDRQRLLAQHPEFENRPDSYGTTARRALSESEAAILMHDAA